MSIAKILVPVRGDGKGETVLAHAALIAKRHNAHVEAVHCRARPQDLIPYGVVVPSALRKQIEAQAVELANAEEANLLNLFRDLMARLGLELVEQGTVPPTDKPTAGWYEEQGKQMDVIKSHGRLADLVAVAKPDRDRNLGVNTLKAALFNTGRPVLICPPTAPKTLGDRVAIAWNGSTEAARAVALAMPLIQTAGEVVILDGGVADHGATGAELVHYLATRGVKARTAPIHVTDDPGATILSHAVGVVGADLLVMGAYSRSRDQEAVFGGATQHVVDHTSIPVVMVH